MSSALAAPLATSLRRMPGCITLRGIKRPNRTARNGGCRGRREDRMKKTIVLLAVLTIATSAAPQAAQPARHSLDPDWPCQQVKVGEPSVASFWNGPAIDPATADWQQDQDVATLVGALTQRRLPMDTALQRIDAFAKAAG